MRRDSILEQTWRTARAVASRRLPRNLVSTIDAEDVASEVIVRLLPRMDQLGEEAVSMAAAAAKGVIIDFWRASKAIKRDRSRMAKTQAGPSAIEELVAGETLASILRGLGSIETSIVELKVSGASTPEAAREVGWCKRRAQRLLLELRARTD